MPAPRPLTVLVVEDHDDSRDMLVEALEHAGLRAIPCMSAHEAMERVAMQRPDAIITDLALAGEQGAVLAAELRARAETRDLPIVAVTGRVEPTLEVVKHFDAYLRKPVDVSTLPSLVKTLVEVTALAREQRRAR
jgi:CheY-like chemotaxis protein